MVEFLRREMYANRLIADEFEHLARKLSWSAVDSLASPFRRRSIELDERLELMVGGVGCGMDGHKL